VDLSSPRAVSSRAERPVFFNSGHPFSDYLSSVWRPFPALDASGGNVTHTALHLAQCLGSRRVFLYGADFSYPRGKSYANGTYLYSYFAQRENRFSGLESSFQGFLYRSPRLERERIEDGGIRYLTPQLNQYRENLEGLISRLGCQVIPRRGLGQGIRVNPATGIARAPLEERFYLAKANPAQKPWEDVLKDFSMALRALPLNELKTAADLLSLSGQERLVGRTLLPIAAAIYRERGNLGGQGLLSASRDWMLGRIEWALRPEAGH
jgi:hypothetical protein